MTSGVYQLTFSSGDTYIGKSIDCANRWKQHADKFLKGTAAKNMQQAYNLYGMPDARVLIECHEDHIDIVEACLISRLGPTLNGTRPEDPFRNVIGEDSFDTVISFLNRSTLQHIIELVNYNNTKAEQEQKVDELAASILKLEYNIMQLRKQRSEEELTKDINKRISNLTKENKNLISERNEFEAACAQLTKRVQYYQQPWWKKIF